MGRKSQHGRGDRVTKQKNALVYIDVGISDAKDYWNNVVIPWTEEFQTHPSTHTGMALASSLWHIHEWIWYDKHPNVNTRASEDYRAFRKRIAAECPELTWLEDLTNTGKPRALAHPGSAMVKQSEVAGRGGAGGYGVKAQMAYGSGKPQLCLHFQDGSVHWLGDVCKRAFEYWKEHDFS